MRILNDAGEFLVNLHNWRWLEGTERSLDLHSGKSYVWLPSNFRELIAIQTTDGLNAGIQMTTQRQLVELRSQAAANSYMYHAAVVHAQRQTFASVSGVFSAAAADGCKITMNDGENATCYFEYDPLPGVVDITKTNREVLIGGSASDSAANLADAINDAPALYIQATSSGANITVTSTLPGLRGNLSSVGKSVGTSNLLWTAKDNDTEVATSFFGAYGPAAPRPRLDIWPTPTSDAPAGIRVYYRSGWMKVTDDNQMLYLPEWMETLYIFLVRAFARSYEREGDGSVSVRLNDIKMGPLFTQAQQRDKEMTPDIGPLTNGAVGSMYGNPDPMWNFSSTSGPS